MAVDSNRPPEPAELEPLAAHVWYEVQAFAIASHELLEVGRTADELSAEEEVHRNALVTRTLVHQRNVTYFFEDDPIKDDVTARHYVPTWDPEVHGGADLELLSSSMLFIHKHLAHFTAERHREASAEPPDVERARNAVEVLWCKFLEELEPEQRQWFDDPLPRD